jgi:hypothetical protein
MRAESRSEGHFWEQTRCAVRQRKTDQVPMYRHRLFPSRTLLPGLCMASIPSEPSLFQPCKSSVFSLPARCPLAGHRLHETRARADTQPARSLPCLCFLFPFSNSTPTDHTTGVLRGCRCVKRNASLSSCSCKASVLWRGVPRLLFGFNIPLSLPASSRLPVCFSFSLLISMLISPLTHLLLTPLCPSSLVSLPSSKTNNTL